MAVGDYVLYKGHRCRMMMERWKGTCGCMSRIHCDAVRPIGYIPPRRAGSPSQGFLQLERVASLGMPTPLWHLVYVSARQDAKRNW